METLSISPLFTILALATVPISSDCLINWDHDYKTFHSPLFSSVVCSCTCMCTCAHMTTHLRSILTRQKTLALSSQSSGSDIPKEKCMRKTLVSISLCLVSMITTYKLNYKYFIYYYFSSACTPETMPPKMYSFNILCDRSLHSSLDSNHLNIPSPTFQICNSFFS